MALILNLLAQMDSTKLMNLNDGSPPLSDTASYGAPWVVALFLTALTVLVTSKTSKRNHLERD